MSPPSAPGRAARSRRRRTDVRTAPPRRRSSRSPSSRSARSSSPPSAAASTRPRTITAPAERRAPAAGRPAGAEAVARLGDADARACRQPEPGHGDRLLRRLRRRRSGSTPIGTQANQGLLKRARARDLRRRLGIAALVPAPRRGRAVDLGARRRRAARDRRLRPGRRHDRRDREGHAQRQGLRASGSTSSRRTAPSLVVSVSDLAADPSLAVGAAVTAGSSKLGDARSTSSKVETQSLARYTNDAGNHVLIEVHPAATLASMSR